MKCGKKAFVWINCLDCTLDMPSENKILVLPKQNSQTLVTTGSDTKDLTKQEKIFNIARSRLISQKTPLRQAVLEKTLLENITLTSKQAGISVETKKKMQSASCARVRPCSKGNLNCDQLSDKENIKLPVNTCDGNSVTQDGDSSAQAALSSQNKRLRKRRKTRELPVRGTYLADLTPNDLMKMPQQQLVDLTLDLLFKYNQLGPLNSQAMNDQKFIKDFNISVKYLNEMSMKEVALMENQKIIEEKDDKISSQQKQIESLQLEIAELRALRARGTGDLAATNVLFPTHADQTLEKSFRLPVDEFNSSGRRSRADRLSSFSETMAYLSGFKRQERETLLQNILVNQKETLDFYSLLCGLSVSKERIQSPHQLLDVDTYSCQIQFNRGNLDDLKFNMILDYDKNEVEYVPPDLDAIGEDQALSAYGFLCKRRKFSADDAYVFLNELISACT